jgi:hypothetical protein
MFRQLAESWAEEGGQWQTSDGPEKEISPAPFKYVWDSREVREMALEALVELQCYSLDQWFCAPGVRSAEVSMPVSSASSLNFRALQSLMSRDSRNQLVFED